jgi:pimeloyl-ACP methyl ester carboxylesterase
MPTLSVEGADVHYEVQGQGPPMIFIPGTAMEGSFWSHFQVPEFARDHTTIIFDPRGTGRTVTRVKDYSTNRLAADVAALIAHVNLGPAVVFGHSMGGRVAQFVALDHAQHVRALVLASTGSSFKSKGGIPARTCLGIIDKGYAPYLREHTEWIGFSDAYRAREPDSVKRFIDWFIDTLAPIEVYFDHVLSRQDHETTARLPFIRCPTLVTVGGDEAHGTSDTTHVASAHLLARMIPGARFEMLEGEGHFYTHSAPQALHRLVRDFLATCGRKEDRR